MGALYPPVDPFETGTVEVGDGNRTAWERCGRAGAKPALVLHGGPGSGRHPSHRRYFDPDAWEVVLFDQRGCGRSTPPASDPETDMSVNTTDHLVQDIEILRQQLDVETWLLVGGSWGSTLALAYAQRHPDCVSEMVLSPVTTSRPSEIDWLYQGLARFLPEEWHRFRSHVGEARAADIVAAYAELMEDPAPEVRTAAADAWCAWEDAVISHEADGDVRVYRDRSLPAREAFVRIASHYFANAAWLADGELFEHMDALAGIPGVLIHGRLDLAAPLETAWELDRRWESAELIVARSAGHTGNEEIAQHRRRALDRFV